MDAPVGHGHLEPVATSFRAGGESRVNIDYTDILPGDDAPDEGDEHRNRPAPVPRAAPAAASQPTAASSNGTSATGTHKALGNATGTHAALSATGTHPALSATGAHPALSATGTHGTPRLS